MPRGFVGTVCSHSAKSSRNRRMRPALRPRSPAPAREAERTSTRVPAPHGVRRITTSSVNPNHRVVSVASMRPLDLSAVTISHPCACATASARSKVAAGGVRKRDGREVRIAVALEDGQLRRPIERVRGVPALGDDGLECRRVFEIRRQVVNQRQALRAPLPRQRDCDRGQRQDQSPAPRRSRRSICAGGRRTRRHRFQSAGATRPMYSAQRMIA